MTKVITVSQKFPDYHPKAGQPTYFVEKILNSLGSPKDWSRFADNLSQLKEYLNFDINDQKHHTIRAGHRFKSGDMASLRVWGNDINPKSGRSGPYHSKQIIIAPDVKVKVWDFEIKVDGDLIHIGLDDWPFFEENEEFVTQPEALKELAMNDGLSVEDFKSWFKYPKPFEGQIISWSEIPNY